MKRFLSLFVTIFCIVNISYSQDYGVQVPNSDFEAEWKTYKGNKKEGKEPYCWHSFMSANVTTLTQLAATEHIAKDENVRPGSKGMYSVRIYPKKVFGVMANGSLTNGRMNAKSTTATSDDNNIFTDRGTAEFNTKIDEVPDSVTVWLCFYSSSESNQAAFHCAVHGDSNFILYGSGKDGNASQQYSDANYEFSRTTSSASELVWKRMSIPFVVKGTCTDPQYVLITMSTNKTPAKGDENDKLYVDDIVLIYNPTLKTGTLAQTDYEGDANESIAIQVPFTLTGSMSVSNLNKEANQVIAQLSDANGNFDNPVELGRITTNTSGVVEGKIPASVGDGNYKVRVVSTNYPMTAEPSASEITVKRYYQISFGEYDSDMVTLSGAGKYYVSGDLNVTVAAEMQTEECKFAYWMENESVISLDPMYSFTIDKSHTFSAVLKKQYSVSVSASAGGTVSTEGGLFLGNDACQVVATPDEGFSFSSWTVDGEVVSTNPSYTFLVQSDVNLVANFKKSIVVSATVNLSGAGAVSGAGEFNIDKDSVEVTLVAVSNDENKYQFICWKEADTIVSNSMTFTFKTLESRQFVAFFTARVQITAVATEGGSVTGAGSFNSGETASLIAFPEDSYRFVGWYEADTLYNVNTMIEVPTDADRTFEARFAKQYSITVVSNPENAAICSGSGLYDAASEISISANGKAGFVFQNWTVNDMIVLEDETTIVTIDSSFTITANYVELPKYVVSVSQDPLVGGSVSGQGTYFEIETVVVTAIPNKGYDFVNWTENGVEISTDETIEFAALVDRSLVAHFAPNFVGLMVELVVEEGGVVSGMGLYEENSEVSVTATPSEKYSFLSWTNKAGEVVSTNANYVFTLTSDIVLQANFERFYSKYQISVISADETAGTVEGEKKYTEEDEVVVIAKPNEGYRFLHWLEDEKVVSTDAEYHFICLNKRNLTAVFQKVYTITIADFEGGTVKGLGTGVFDEGASVTLAVTVDENHRFVSWVQAEDSTVLSTSVVYTFTASEDKTIAVILKEKAKLCTVSVQTGGSVSGLRNGQYEAGEKVTLIATPTEGYVFSGWLLNGEIVETATLLTLEVSDDMNINAVFVPVPKTVEVTVSVNDETFGTVIGAGAYKEGDEVQLFATPALGYEFVGWTKNGHLLSNLSTLYITVVDDCTIEAEFKFIEKETDNTAVDDVTVNCEVYPNPVSSLLHIVSDNEISSVQLISTKGQIVYRNDDLAQQYSIDVASLKAGVYIVVVTINGESIQKQIVVR
ncbi:MAG: InlB B-repeat-containing protein [Bacteroidales bacterium]|nr:InlB B-repeat-containing protein [Bacteroidales bacterium]